MLLNHNEKFIVPFIFENSYEEVRNILLNKKVKGMDYFLPVKELQETELHAFINRRFWAEDNSHCAIFSVNQNLARNLFEKVYDTVTDLNIFVRNIHIYLFKSGIMFVVFSMEYQKEGGELTFYDIEETNAYIKDLYVHTNRFLVFDSKIKLADSIPEEKSLDTIGILEAEAQYTESGTQKITLLNKKNEPLFSTQTQLYLNSETGEYIRRENGFFTTVKNKPNMIKCYKQEVFSLSGILDQLVLELGIDFSDYFSGSTKSKYPKKALLFNMHVLQGEKEKDIRNDLFYCSHGYTHKYQNNPIGNEVFSAFENSFWLVTREGIANINSLEENEKDHYLNEEFKTRFEVVYLWIYILVLHQYYGLQFYTCSLLTVYKDSLKASKKQLKKVIERLKDIKNDGDLFLLRYCFTDISQISHQNDLYDRMTETYHIEELISDYKNNTEICNNIITEKHQKSMEKKMNIIAAITSVCSIFSAVVQTISSMFSFEDEFLIFLPILVIITVIGALLYMLKGDT